MRSSFFILPLLLLAACAPHPEVRIHTVKCVTPEQYATLVKAKPAKVGNTLTGDAQQDFKIVTGKDVLLEQYTDGLLAVIGSCVGEASR